MFFEAILFLFATLLLFHFRFSNKKKKLPPGPIKWPVIGNIIELAIANPTYPHLAMTKLAEKYGEVVHFGFGVNDAVLVSSFEAVKEIFTKQEANTKRYEMHFVKDRAFQKNGLGLIWASGQSWHETRRFTVRSLRELGLGKTNFMDIVMQEEMVDFVSWINSAVEKTNGILEVDPHRLTANAANIIWGFVAGHRFSLEDERLAATVRHNDNVIKAVGHSNIYAPFPFLQDWFPNWGPHQKNLETHKALQDFMRQIIKELRTKKVLKNMDEPENFVEAYLDEIDKNADNPQSYFSEESLIVILMDLFLAGGETSSTAINWGILYLVLHPEVQEKVYKEISNHMETHDNISVSDMPRFPYLKAMLLETFRFSSLIPLPGPRTTTADIPYKDYVIPKGTCLFMNLHSIFMDKGYWGDPEVFRPERFLDETLKVLVNTERVIAFGIGKRACLGESIAWDSIFITITTLCKNFKLEAIPGKEPSPDKPNSNATISPRTFSIKVDNRK